MVTYLSGPMTGAHGYNYHVFNEAALDLQAKGFDIINPVEIEPPIRSYIGFLRGDIKGLMDATRVIALPNWKRSRGARIEVFLANNLGYPILSYPTLAIVKIRWYQKLWFYPALWLITFRLRNSY